MPKIEFAKNREKIEKEKRQVLTLTITRDCNLRCNYCYESFALRGKETMTLETAQAAITRYMRAENEFKAVEIQLFGGEPMLKFPLIKEIVEWFLAQSWKKSFVFFLCTNATILTDEMKSWLVQHKKVVIPGFSLDGNRTAHNLLRNNSYDLMKPNLSFFMEHWPTQPAKMTVTKDTVYYLADSIIELEEMGLNFTANMIFENEWDSQEEKEKMLAVYQEQLDRLVDYYAKNPHLNPVGPMLTCYLEAYNQSYSDITTPDGECVRFCGAGHEIVMIDVDGTEYPCHRFAPWVAKRPAPKEPINRQKEWKGPEKCKSCKVVLVCPTCAGYNWEVNGDTGIRTTAHCDTYKLEYLASAKLEAIRLSQLDRSKIPEEKLGREKARLEAILGLVKEGL